MSCSTANSPWRSKYSPPHMQLLPESMHSRTHTHQPDYHSACMSPHPPCSKGVLVSVAPAALLVQPLVVVHTLERLGTSGGLQNNRQQQSRAEHSMADNLAQAYTVCFRTSGENTAATLQGRAHRCGGNCCKYFIVRWDACNPHHAQHSSCGLTTGCGACYLKPLYRVLAYATCMHGKGNTIKAYY
jgi:hypothetical protein